MTLFAPDLVEALGWTLLHSLWQGLLIFVLLVPILVYVKKRAFARKSCAFVLEDADLASLLLGDQLV